MTGFDHVLRQYLRTVLDAEIVPTRWAGASRLPPFLTDRYHFLQARLFEHHVLFMVDESQEEESPAKIRKHIAQVRLKCDWPVVYVREYVSTYNRMRLIQQRVPFVVPGNQMYLLDLGIHLLEHFQKPVSDLRHFKPSTQATLLHALLQDRQRPLVAAQLAPELGYSAMTLSRAFDEIQAAGLAESRLEGRTRCLYFKAPQRALWEQAQGFLKDPVKSRHFIQPTLHDATGMKAGSSALACYSMLAEPENPVVAVSSRRWIDLREQGTLNILPARDSQAIEVEVWSYAPKPYRAPDVVEPLSLFLSMKELPDERIGMALDQMMEDLPW